MFKDRPRQEVAPFPCILAIRSPPKHVNAVSLFSYQVGKIDGDGLVAKSCLTLATPWTVAHQTPLSMGFPWQECWSAFLSPLPNLGIEPRSPALSRVSCIAGGFFTN